MEKKRTSWNKGLKGAQVGYWKGKRRPELSKKMTGRKYPNRKLSETHKANISLARKKEWDSGKRKRHWKQKPEAIEKARLTHLGKKLSLEHRKKLSEVKVGKYKADKHWNWQGGKTPINLSIRHSHEYRLWRKSVFERDNYTCVWCKAKSTNGKTVFIQADHIKPFAYYPELRFAIDNGRTLCKSCHLKTDTYGTRAKRY